MVLMMGYKICFNREIWIIIPKLSLLPLLIWSTALLKCMWALTPGTVQHLSLHFHYAYQLKVTFLISLYVRFNKIEALKNIKNFMMFMQEINIVISVFVQFSIKCKLRGK